MRLVVTGSSSGIGRALTIRLIRHGHQVWGLARSDQSDFARQCPGHFRGARCDVSVWAEIESAAREITDRWEKIDGLITCAGLQGEVGRALTANALKWSDTVRANLDGTYYALRAFAPAWACPPRRAKIVCFSGGGATKPRANFSAYGAAKTAIVRLVETIAEEERNRPLDINAIAPGAINTRLTDEVIALGPAIAGTAEHQAAEKQKASGGASMDRALDLVEWLLSPDSDGISGRLLSAPWDPWPDLGRHAGKLAGSDIYTLRRILPEERGASWT